MKGSWAGDPAAGPCVYRLEVAATAEAVPAAFLDRDGTLNEAVADPDSGLPESPLRTSDVRLLGGVGAAVQELALAGFTPVCVSNQPAAAKGKVTVPELLAIHERVIALLAHEGAIVGTSLLCLHHPEGVVAELARSCDCRKPAPGMLSAAAAHGVTLDRSWIIGDTDVDVAAGHAAGCRTVLLEYPGSRHKRTGAARPDVRARSLAEGARALISRPAEGAR